MEDQEKPIFEILEDLNCVPQFEMFKEAKILSNNINKLLVGHTIIITELALALSIKGVLIQLENPLLCAERVCLLTKLLVQNHINHDTTIDIEELEDDQ